MSSFKATARTTGRPDLGLAITGLLGFWFICPEIYVANDSAATIANLIEREGSPKPALPRSSS